MTEVQGEFKLHLMCSMNNPLSHLLLSSDCIVPPFVVCGHFWGQYQYVFAVCIIFNVLSLFDDFQVKLMNNGD